MPSISKKEKAFNKLGLNEQQSFIDSKIESLIEYEGKLLDDQDQFDKNYDEQI